jgi:hypothetical protein
VNLTNTCDRASIDWERVKKKAAEILEELAFATPELKDLTLMLGGPMKPHNVLPIGFGYPLLSPCFLCSIYRLPHLLACSLIWSDLLVSGFIGTSSVPWYVIDRFCQSAKIPCWSCQELPCEMAKVLRSSNALLHAYLEINCIMIIASSISLFVAYNVFSHIVPFCFFCRLPASSDPSQETYDRKISILSINILSLSILAGNICIWDICFQLQKG